MNYPDRIAPSNPTYMISMVDPISIGVKTLRIDSQCFFVKRFYHIDLYESLNGIIVVSWLINVMVVYVVLAGILGSKSSPNLCPK